MRRLTKAKRRKRVSRRAKRGVHSSAKSGGEFTYRSSWELKYALYLDGCVDVLAYRYEPYSISYVSNTKTGKLRKYHPDFEVTRADGSKTLVEVKPAKKVCQARNVKKRIAAERFCKDNGMLYSLITEIELKSVGAL